MGIAQDYYDINSKKAVDHSLFDRLHDLVLDLGAEYLSNPVNTYTFLTELKKASVGSINNFIFAVLDNEGQMVLTTNLSYKQKEESLNKIIEELSLIYKTAISIDAQQDMFDLRASDELYNYAKNNLRLSHLFIFKPAFQEVVSESRKLEFLFNEISDIRNQVFQDTYHLICKCISLFIKRVGISSLKMEEMESDIINLCMEYLTSATFRFNPALKLQYSTTATQWINRAIQQVYSSSKQMSYAQYINHSNSVIVETMTDIGKVAGLNDDIQYSDGRDGYRSDIGVDFYYDEFSDNAEIHSELRSSFIHSFAEAGYDRDTSILFFNYYHQEISYEDVLSKLDITKRQFDKILSDCKEALIANLMSESEYTKRQCKEAE